jgi:hypothetical protein
LLIDRAPTRDGELLVERVPLNHKSTAFSGLFSDEFRRMRSHSFRIPLPNFDQAATLLFHNSLNRIPVFGLQLRRVDLVFENQLLLPRPPFQGLGPHPFGPLLLQAEPTLAGCQIGLELQNGRAMFSILRFHGCLIGGGIGDQLVDI